MELTNTTNKNFNFLFGTHSPGETKSYSETIGKNILSSYPDHFKQTTEKNSGGNKKCRK